MLTTWNAQLCNKCAHLILNVKHIFFVIPYLHCHFSAIHSFRIDAFSCVSADQAICVWFGWSVNLFCTRPDCEHAHACLSTLSALMRNISCGTRSSMGINFRFFLCKKSFAWLAKNIISCGALLIWKCNLIFWDFQVSV